MLTREQLMAKLNAKKAGTTAPDPVSDAPKPEDIPKNIEPPPQSRLERIRADAARINRADTAAAQGKAPVAETPKKEPELPIPAADLSNEEPAPEPVADPPKRRGRPRKVNTGSALLDKAIEATTEPEADPGPFAGPGDGGTAPLADGYTLYIDCHPIRASVTYAHDLIAKSATTVRDDAGVPDVGLIDYGKGGPALAAQLRSDLLDTPVTGALVTTKYTPEGKATLQVLIEGAREVIMGH